MKNPLYGGVDVGSTWTKAVILDEQARVVARNVRRTGISFERSSIETFSDGLGAMGADRSRVSIVIATGYGRHNAEFADGVRTEISCHARGATIGFSRPVDVVDIGGQDNKIIRISESGAVENFVMNRKCAAGTGAFIEEISRRLDISLDELEQMAEEADKELVLASFCTVFSATEVIKLIREGEGAENIARGIFNSVISRVVEMGVLGSNIVLTGGVAGAFPITGKLLEEKSGAKVAIPPYPQFTGALGAALEAYDAR